MLAVAFKSAALGEPPTAPANCASVLLVLLEIFPPLLRSLAALRSRFTAFRSLFAAFFCALLNFFQSSLLQPQPCPYQVRRCLTGRLRDRAESRRAGRRLCSGRSGSLVGRGLRHDRGPRRAARGEHARGRQEHTDAGSRNEPAVESNKVIEVPMKKRAWVSVACRHPYRAVGPFRPFREVAELTERYTIGP